MIVPLSGANFQPPARLQIRDVLTTPSAESIRTVLKDRTPWCLAWQAGADGPHLIKPDQLASVTQAEAAAIQGKLNSALNGGRYAFVYSSYPMVEAYLQRWHPGSPHERLLKQINREALLGLVREVTGMNDLVKADA